MTPIKNISGAGSGGDGGGGGHTPVESPDNLRSVSTVRILDLLCEGPIEGLVGGLKGIYLDDVPILKSNAEDLPEEDQFNFKLGLDAVRWVYGDDGQEAIPNVPSSETETAVSVEVTKATPVVRTITTAGLDKARVTIGIPALQTVNQTTGDVYGAAVEIQIEVQPDGESYQVVDLSGAGEIRGKTTSRYQRTYEFGLPGSAPWNIRVSRLTDDSANPSTLQDKTYWDSYTEVQMEKLSYPGSAIIGIKLDASQFKNIPNRAYHVKLLKVLVPSNYDPRTRTYTGTWDGTFYRTWTDNPAWCLYDLMTDTNHGLGAYISDDQVDKWALYEIGQYCDEMVDDGKGGTEPRFTCNMLLQRREDAWKVVQDMCSIFRGLAYWVAGTIQPVQDAPRDAVALFTPSNVIEGKFSYSGSSRMSRHNAVLVAWNDPTDRYKQKTELVMLDSDVAARGLRQTEIVALGCTSQGQAHRVGRWLLYTELYETETVVFSTGLEGAALRPGDIIVVQDDYRAPSVGAGRVAATPTATDAIALDSSVTLAPATTYKARVFTGDETTPFEERTISTAAGTVTSITVSSAFDTPPVEGAAYQILESTAAPSTYRVLSISEQAPNIFEVTAMSYDADKYTFVESNLNLQEPPGGGGNDLPSDILAAPANLGITEYLYISGEAVKDRMHIYWDKVTNAASYFGQWRKDNTSWVDFTTTELAFDVLDVTPGLYEARVCAISQSGKKGLFSRKSTTLVGKEAPPADVTNFKATGGETTVELTWDAVADLDLSHYVIKEGASWAAGTEIFKGNARHFTWQKAPVNGISVWIKAEDTSGNQSANATQATIGGGSNPATDDYIYPLQKPKIIEEWARVGSEKSDLDAKASAAGVSPTAYDTAYTNLSNYLTDVTRYSSGGTEYYIYRDSGDHVGESWAVAPGVAVYLGPGGGAYWRGLWNAYYAARDVLSNAIKNVGTNPNIVSIDQKRSIKAEYDTLKAEETALVARASECGVSSTSYTDALRAMEAYMDGLNTANGWSGEDWSDYSYAYDLTSTTPPTSWYALVQIYKTVYTTRDALRAAIEQVLTDRDWVAPSEKYTLKQRYDTVLAEQVVLDADADAAGVSRTAYDAAVGWASPTPTGLVGMIGDSGTHPCFTNMNAPTYLGSGGRTTMEGYFKTIADEKKKLESAIETGRLAALPQDTFRVVKYWDFNSDNGNAGWMLGDMTGADSDSGTTRTYTATSADPILYSPDIDLAGRNCYVVMARVKLVSGSWQGTCYFTGTSPSVTYSGSYEKTIAGPVLGEWRELAWDMRDLTAGGTAYVANTNIDTIRLDLGATNGGVVVIDWIAIGVYGSGSKADYDLAVANAATLYMDKATFLDGGKIKGTEIKDESIKTPSLAANIIFSKNLVVANFDNLIPNPSSELAALSNIPADSIDKAGCYEAGTGAYSGSWVRKLTCAGGYAALYLVDKGIPCTPGDQFHASAWAKIASGTGILTIGFGFRDKDGTTVGWATPVTATNPAVYTQITASGTAPATAVTVWPYIEQSSAGSTDTSYFDGLYFRRMADANLIVDGAIQANHITAGAVQTYHLSVGPLIEFKGRASGGAVLKGYADGSYGRDPSPPSGYAENATDAAWYADPSRIYPSSGCDSNLYEFNSGIGTSGRGIIINLADPFPTGSAGGLLVYHNSTTLSLYKVPSIGTYTAITSATVPAASANDKLTVIYYNTAGTSAATRMQVYLNGQLVTWATGRSSISDTDLGVGYYGAKAGYAGVYLADTTVKVWGLKFGKGSVVIQDGVITADKLVADFAIVNTVRSNNYAAGSHSAACTGFKMANTAFDVALKTPPGGTDTHVNAQLEIGSDAVIGGYKAAVITNNSIGGYQEFTTAGSHTFTIPEGVQKLRIICIGGGGGGGGGNHTAGIQAGGGGGAGGGSLVGWYDVPSGTTELSVTVGSGGVGGNASDGGAGTYSCVFLSPYYICKAFGGGAGLYPYSTYRGGGGDGGTVEWSLDSELDVGGGADSLGGVGKILGLDGNVSATFGQAGVVEQFMYTVESFASGGGGGGGCPEGTDITVYSGSGGTCDLRGGGPGTYQSASTSGACGGGGGSTYRARGGTGGGYGTPRAALGGTLINGIAGTYGAGGGGGGTSASASGLGGAGGAGYVRFEW